MSQPSATKSCGTSSDDSSGGTVAWSNPGNVAAGSGAATVSPSSGISHFLDGTNFGFTVPPTAVITGISVSITHSTTLSGTIQDSAVQLIKGGAVGGNNEAAGGNWNSSSATVTYGSATDLWGQTWLASDINSPLFGVALAITGNGNANVTAITITVYWVGWTEHKLSRGGEINYDNPTVDIKFTASGTMDDSVVVNAINQNVPATWTVNGLVMFINRIKYRCPMGNGVWDIVASYANNPNYTELSIDLSTTHQKIFQSIETVTQYDCVNGGTVSPTFQRAIGVNGQQVAGVDIEIPKEAFSVLIKLKLSTLSSTYLDTLKALVATVNESVYTITWKGQTRTFQARELKFLGAPSKQTSNDDLEITFKFEAQDSLTNADGFTIGSSGTITKDGWDYMWVQYQERFDATINAMVSRPIYVVIEQVYQATDFTLLGL